MTLLTAILTHLDAGAVDRQLAYLNELAPAARFLVCHGGARDEFDRLDAEAVFVDEPSLRGEPWNQSYTGVLKAIFESGVRDDPEVDFLYFVEFDHLILRPDFEAPLVELASRLDAGLLAKRAFRADDTNWMHLTRHRGDEELDRFIAGISVREDPTERWGCLGTGMLFRRDALEAFCSAPDPPHAYLELFVPTVVHHLGFEVADVDAHSDLYASVRWRPDFGVEEAIAAKEAGHAFLHPFKRLDGLDAIRGA